MSIYRSIARNQWQSVLLVGGFVTFVTVLFWLSGLYIGGGESYWIIGFVVAIVSSCFSYFFSDRIVLASVRARPADKQTYFDFYTVTENLCIASGLPMPRLYVIDDPSPNAFATGRNPQNAVICATTGLLKMLDRAELEGVIAHELAHIKNYDILLASLVSVLVGTVAIATDMLLRSLALSKTNDSRGSSRNPITVPLFIIAAILAPLAATIIQLAISRRREFLADASAALLTRYPAGLARALEKITAYPRGVKTATTGTAHMFFANPFKKRDAGEDWIRRLFSTHPPPEERIKALLEM